MENNLETIFEINTLWTMSGTAAVQPPNAASVKIESRPNRVRKRRREGERARAEEHAFDVYKQVEPSLQLFYWYLAILSVPETTTT